MIGRASATTVNIWDVAHGALFVKAARTPLPPWFSLRRLIKPSEDELR